MTNYQQEAEVIVRLHGTKDEVERLDAGVLPERELDLIVSDVLFSAILDLPIRRKAKEESVRRHAVDLGLADENSKVTFRVVDEEDLEELTSTEWATLQRVRNSMLGAKIRTFEVIVECGRYRRRSTYASVEVQLGDRWRRLDVALNPSEHQRGRQRQPEVDRRVHRSSKVRD